MISVVILFVGHLSRRFNKKPNDAVTVQQGTVHFNGQAKIRKL